MELKHEADRMVTKCRKRSRGQRGDIRPINDDFSRGHNIQSSEHMQERGFSRSRRSDYGDHLSGSDREINPFEDFKRTTAECEGLS